MHDILRVITPAWPFAVAALGMTIYFTRLHVNAERRRRKARTAAPPEDRELAP